MVLAIERAVPATGNDSSGDNADLAATLLRLDGRDRLWTACGLRSDPDVLAWALGALDVLHPDYASLFWPELVAMRLSRN